MSQRVCSVPPWGWDLPPVSPCLLNPCAQQTCPWKSLFLPGPRSRMNAVERGWHLSPPRKDVQRAVGPGGSRWPLAEDGEGRTADGGVGLAWGCAGPGVAGGFGRTGPGSTDTCGKVWCRPCPPLVPSSRPPSPRLPSTHQRPMGRLPVKMAMWSYTRRPGHS